MKMQIVYNPHSTLALLKYGIQIPVTDFRDKLIADAMTKRGVRIDIIDQKLNLLQRSDLTRVHQKEFIARLENPQTLTHEIMSCFELINSDGSYHRYSPETAVREFSHLYQCILGKVETAIYAAQYCLKGENAFLLGGGFHHAMSFGGRGFCLLNDIVITLEKLRAEKKINSAWIIDVDAHKGDGTAELTQFNPHLSTLSIHMKSGWPLDSTNDANAPWLIPSTVDIEIAKGEEETYLDKLKEGLLRLESHHPQADMAIVVLGADPYEKDELPSAFLLNLTLSQMKERDLLVHQFLRDRKVPVLYVMGGGYGAHSHEPYLEFLTALFECGLSKT